MFKKCCNDVMLRTTNYFIRKIQIWTIVLSIHPLVNKTWRAVCRRLSAKQSIILGFKWLNTGYMSQIIHPSEQLRSVSHFFHTGPHQIIKICNMVLWGDSTASVMSHDKRNSCHMRLLTIFEWSCNFCTICHNFLC